MADRADDTGAARRFSRRRAAGMVASLIALAAGAAVSPAAAQDAPPAATEDANATPAPAAPEPITPPQPGYDGIRVAQDGHLAPYSIWVNLPPVLVTTPDGGAWAFFTARARVGDTTGSNELFAARFDPKAQLWRPAAALPGNDVQFGPAAVVDAKGAVHLIYSARPSESATANSTLMYTVSRDGQTWETPKPVAPDPNAGMQVMADLAIDGKGVLHAIWRDQRVGNGSVSPNDQSDGDLYVSDFANGAWSTPVQLTGLKGATDFVAWPRIECDGDRLVVLWSVYSQRSTGADSGRKADRVVWSSRPLAAPNQWSAPATLVEPKDGDEIGSQLVDLAADPRGGVVAVSTRLDRSGASVTGTVSLLRLAPGSNEWSAPQPVATGNLGYFPSLAISRDGIAYIAFNDGAGRRVEVGMVAASVDSGQAGAEIAPTAGESGEHGRPSVAIAPDGRPWLIYMHGETSSNSIELRAQRGVVIDAGP
ncbi:MAG TPA: sialidase family protein [Thermomicrobiales bacterium]|nr:sialidase family protein [Thermomicrobiales bacterium]